MPLVVGFIWVWNVRAYWTQHSYASRGDKIGYAAMTGGIALLSGLFLWFCLNIAFGRKQTRMERACYELGYTCDKEGDPKGSSRYDP